MSALPPRWLASIPVAISFCCVACLSDGHAQPVPKSGAYSKDYIGAKNCLGCHGNYDPKTTKETDNGPVIYPEVAKDFLLMRESLIWGKSDLHARGYEALSSPLGQQMARLLGWKVTEKAECLVCHSVDLSPGKPLDQRDVAKDFHVESNVGCEACHGKATKWFAPHIAPTLRTDTPAAKEDLGLWDMRNPVRRAERCTSCHVGNWKEGRFVTHEMYAAGHPPLLPLEVAAFSHDQPQHYKPAKQLPFVTEMAKQNPEQCWSLYHYRANESYTARLTAVSAVVSLGASTRLLSDAAADPKTTVLDLAHFDCAACHHDLEPNSWRQQRGFIGIPGRAQPRAGQAFLSRLVAEHSKPGAADELKAMYAKLTQSFDARPFGDKVRVSEVGKQLSDWCDSYAGVALQPGNPGRPGSLDKTTYDTAATKRLIHAIADAAKAPPADSKDAWLDFDTAQQLIWAIESLRTDVEPADGPIGQALAEVKAKLPPHVRDSTNRDFIAKGLKARFDRAAEFTPDDLYRTMSKVADLTK